MAVFPKNPAKILIRSTNWIGDAIMTIPAVRSIRNNYPDAEITILALPWVADVFVASPWIDKIFIYEKKGRHHGLRGRLQLISQLKKEKFDAAVLLQNAFEAALITFLAGIPIRGGYGTDGRALLLTHRVKKTSEIKGKHEVYYYQEMIAGLGISPGANKLELFLANETLINAENSLKSFRQTEGVPKKSPVIGFNPGAAYGPAKRWPAEKFALLAKEICRQLTGIVVIFGTDADTQSAKIIKEGSGSPQQVLDLTGKTDLAAAMAYIDLCDVFVTNDSGLMHVAAALATPVAAVFGSTNHIATGPWCDCFRIIREPMACSPCKKTHCPQGHLKCMEDISSEQVFAAVAELLAESRFQEQGKME